MRSSGKEFTTLNIFADFTLEVKPESKTSKELSIRNDKDVADTKGKARLPVSPAV